VANPGSVIQGPGTWRIGDTSWTTYGHMIFANGGWAGMRMKMLQVMTDNTIECNPSCAILPGATWQAIGACVSRSCLIFVWAFEDG